MSLKYRFKLLKKILFLEQPWYCKLNKLIFTDHWRIRLLIHWAYRGVIELRNFPLSSKCELQNLKIYFLQYQNISPSISISNIPFCFFLDNFSAHSHWSDYPGLNLTVAGLVVADLLNWRHLCWLSWHWKSCIYLKYNFLSNNLYYLNTENMYIIL